MEMKAIADVCSTIQEFPPGHYLESGSAEPVRYYEPAWRDYDSVAAGSSDPAAVRDALEAAVPRPVHLAHTPRPQRRDDLVRTDLAAG